jgi:hypothetical protein
MLGGIGFGDAACKECFEDVNASGIMGTVEAQVVMTSLMLVHVF